MYGNRFPHLEALSPDRTWFLTIQEHNLRLRSTVDGTLTQLTFDGAEDLDWDFEAARPVGGTASSIPSPWSPDGLTVFATQVDRRQVVKEPRVHFLKTNTEVEWFPSDKPGTPRSHFTPYLVHALGSPPAPIDLDDTRDRYFLFLGWQPDGVEALFLCCSRDFRRVDVMAAKAATGRTRTILTEEGTTFVRVQHDILFFHRPGFTLLPDGAGFLWQSERDGWSHLYLYDFDGTLIRRLTAGTFPVLDVQAIDGDAGHVYFTAHAEPRLYDTHLYRVPLAGGDMERLTEGAGQHRIQFSPSKQFFLDTHSGVDRPPVVELRAAGGPVGSSRTGCVRTLREVDIRRLEATGWTPPEEFAVKAADGETDLWGVLFKPYDFDPSQSYPVVEHIYGGPQTTYAPRDFTISPLPAQNYPRALAQLGFMVVMLDARGTPERSKAFHDTVYGNWGRQEIPDHAGAIRQLGRERPYMDLNRVGIFGHSWGGYFAFKALVQAPDLYRAAVVSGPALDAMSILSEPYLGLLEANKPAYDYASLYQFAPQVQGSLLLIAGTNEPPMLAAVMRMTHALIEAGIHHELIVLPEQHHGYAGKSMTYVLEATTRFFSKL
jgi:dipeptidyl aminopeptidase/acylaminoacyl peptidase